MALSRPLLHILSPFRPAFTRPTWKNMLVLVEGTLLARGRRTVTEPCGDGVVGNFTSISFTTR